MWRRLQRLLDQPTRSTAWRVDKDVFDIFKFRFFAVCEVTSHHTAAGDTSFLQHQSQSLTALLVELKGGDGPERQSDNAPAETQTPGVFLSLCSVIHWYNVPRVSRSLSPFQFPDFRGSVLAISNFPPIWSTQRRQGLDGDCWIVKRLDREGDEP